MSLDAALMRVMARLDALEREAERKRAVDVPAGRPTLLLNYTHAADTINGATLSTTLIDVTTSQNFSVLKALNVIDVETRGTMFVTNSTAGWCAVYLNVDGTTYKISSQYIDGTNYGSIILGFNATVSLTNLATGTHTVKIQVNAPSGAQIVYCRCSSVPSLEFAFVQVVEYD